MTRLGDSYSALAEDRVKLRPGIFVPAAKYIQRTGAVGADRPIISSSPTPAMTATASRFRSYPAACVGSFERLCVTRVSSSRRHGGGGRPERQENTRIDEGELENRIVGLSPPRRPYARRTMRTPFT
jgi:hypothetical protein